MPVVKNVSPASVILPDGTELASGAALPVDDKVWKEHAEHPVVKGWVEEEKRLVVGGKELLGPDADVDPLLDAARHGEPTAGRRLGITPTPDVADTAARAEANTEIDRIEAEVAKSGEPMKPVESELLSSAPPAASTMVNPEQKLFEGADKQQAASPEGSNPEEPVKAAEATRKAEADLSAQAAKGSEPARGAEPAKAPKK